MKQRINRLLLFKKQLGAFQRVGRNTYAIANRLMNDSLFGAPRPIAGWSDGEDCAGGGNVVVDFSDPVFFTDGTLGITITATGSKTYPVTSALTSGQNDISYVGTWSTALAAGDIVTVSYDATVGDYNDGAADPDTSYVRSFSTKADNCLDPPVVTSAYATNQVSEAQHIVVTFDRPLNGNSVLGVSWVGLDTDPPGSVLSGVSYATYIVDAGQTLYDDDVVDWSYNPTTGNLTREDSGTELEAVNNFPVNVSGLDSRPPVTSDSWATESGGVWNTETGDNWILE